MQIETLLIITGVGLVAGFVDTLAGGGGMMTIPTYLLLGLPPHVAVGSNKLSATLGIANASRIFLRKRLFQPRYWAAALIASTVGAAIGAAAVHFLQAELLRKIFPVIILILVVYLVWPKRRQSEIKSHVIPNTKTSSIIAVALGFYDGFFGPGTGSIWVALLMSIFRINILEATAIAKLMNFVSNLTALIVFIGYGSVNYTYGVTMGAAMMVGAHFAAHSAFKFGVNYIRWVFISVVSLMAIYLLTTQFVMLVS